MSTVKMLYSGNCAHGFGEPLLSQHSLQYIYLYAAITPRKKLESLQLHKCISLWGK